MEKEKLAVFSIIGRGRQRKDKTRGYEQTKYVFNPGSKENAYETKETAFFGISLYEYLSKKLNDVPEKFVILGTNKSAWSELVSLIPEEKQGELSTITLYDKLYNQENDDSSFVSKETLQEWEGLLREFVPSIRLYIIEPLDFYTYVDIILKEIDDNSTYKLVFDCTHGYRYIPIVFSYAVMLAKKLRKVQQIRFFYGAFEMKEYYDFPENTSPVVEIDAVNHFIELIEATSIYNVSGYFPNILSLIGIPDTNETYFKLEMNQNPRTEIIKISNNLGTISNTHKHFYIREISGKLLRDFQELANQEKVYMRLFKRAKFFFEHYNYLKALTLIFESTVMVFTDAYGIKKDYLSYETRSEARKKMRQEIKNILYYDKPERNILIKEKQEAESLKILEAVRNSAAHGSIPHVNQKYLVNEKEFKKLFTSACTTFEKMVERLKKSRQLQN